MNDPLYSSKSLWGVVWRGATLRRFALLFLIGELVAVVLGCLSPLVQRTLIDSAGNGNGMRTFVAGALLGGIILIGFACRSVGRWARGRLGIELRGAFKSAMFRHLLALPEEYLRSRGIGYFFNRMQDDSTEAASFLAGMGLSLWTDIAKMVLAFSILLVLQWRCALLILPFLFLQGAICFYFRNRQYRLSHRIQECTATERHVMLDYFQNHQTWKAQATGGVAEQRIDSGVGRWQRLMRKRLVHENYFLFWFQLPSWICSGGLVAFGLYQVLEKHWTLGGLWAMLGLMNAAFAPARVLGGGIVQMQSALAAWNRLRELWSVDQEGGAAASGSQKLATDAGNGVRLTGDIVFADISFAYQEQSAVFQKLNLTIPGGKTVLLTGANGSGKSTLLALLLRLCEPSHGTISIGGENISAFSLETYRSRIGYIGQSPEFIQGTLRENLCWGRKIADEKILAVFQRLECAELVLARPGALDAKVAERGENFSGGERLRLALVRELLRDTDILLLDEAAAHLDYEGKLLFYSFLQRIAGEKTILAVVHEIPESFAAERIIRIDEASVNPLSGEPSPEA